MDGEIGDMCCGLRCQHFAIGTEVKNKVTISYMEFQFR